MASVGAFQFDGWLGVYDMTKAALVHLTKHLATELGPKVRVNAIAPGVVQTDFARALWEAGDEGTAAEWPLRRLGQPNDVAQAALFLASDASSWITGEVLVIDGGAQLLSRDTWTG
jgi:NAD(P)-dependent dehydrogenase (short-subunit alcohol dehydrogenase family)